MDLFLKTAAAALVTAVLTLVISRQAKDFSLLLTMAGCAMAAMIFLHFLEPVLTFVKTLQQLGDLNGEMLQILLKTVGVGLISEISAVVCKDAGNESLGKALLLLGAAVILWLSIPVFQMLMDLMQKILGGI